MRSLQTDTPHSSHRCLHTRLWPQPLLSSPLLAGQQGRLRHDAQPASRRPERRRRSGARHVCGALDRAQCGPLGRALAGAVGAPLHVMCCGVAWRCCGGGGGGGGDAHSALAARLRRARILPVGVGVGDAALDAQCSAGLHQSCVLGGAGAQLRSSAAVMARHAMA